MASVLLWPLVLPLPLAGWRCWCWLSRCRVFWLGGDIGGDAGDTESGAKPGEGALLAGSLEWSAVTIPSAAPRTPFAAFSGGVKAASPSAGAVAAAMVRPMLTAGPA